MNFKDFMNQGEEISKKSVISYSEQTQTQKAISNQNDILKKIDIGKGIYNTAMSANGSLHYSSKLQGSPTSKLELPAPTDNPFIEKIGDGWTEDQKNNYYYLLADDDNKAREYARSVNAYSKTLPVLSKPITEGQAQMEILAKEISDLELAKKVQDGKLSYSPMSGWTYGSESGFKPAIDYDTQIKKLKSQ
ncbi:MAG: hypothetical protein IKY45_05360, partial [Clostridia bacterium]|nr:hypothetical protein [Clostridia bacterium]